VLGDLAYQECASGTQYRVGRPLFGCSVSETALTSIWMSAQSSVWVFLRLVGCIAIGESALLQGCLCWNANLEG